MLDRVVAQQDGEQWLGPPRVGGGGGGAGGHLDQGGGEAFAVGAGDPGGLVGEVLVALQAGQFASDDRPVDPPEQSVEADGAIQGGGGMEPGGAFGFGWGVGLGVGPLRPVLDGLDGLRVAQGRALLDQQRFVALEQVVAVRLVGPAE